MGLTTQPKFIGLAMFIAVNVSVSALVARRKGQKNRRGANEVLCAASVFVLVMSVAVSLICVAFADPIIRLCGSEEASHAEAVQYFRIIMGFIIFTVVSLVVNAAQRGAGNTKIACPMCANVNVNYLLIEGHFGFPALGVSGAAIATVIGSVVGCVMSLVAACKGDFISIPYMWKEKIRPTLESAKSMIKIGSSVLAEQLLVRVGFLSVAVMAAKMGTAAFAAHQVGMNVMSLSFSFGDGMQVAAVALIGQSLGAKDVEMAKKYGGICQNIGRMIAVVLAVIYLSCGAFLYRLFFTEPEIIAMGVEIMRVIVVVVLLQIAQVIYMGCLRGAGDVIYTTIASTISVTIVRPIASYLLCYTAGLGIIGIWFGVCADQLVRFILTSLRFRSGKWTKIKI
ncbi:MAG: MATE family efflux transporter [Eisenbergiella massiliensis]